MTDDAAKARAEKLFKAQEREKEGLKAMAEYMQEAEAVRKRTAALRILRLQRHAQDSR
jgi:hypothetical protein